MSTEPQYWIIVSSLSNHHITRDRGFDLQGLKSRQRKKLELVQPGDKFIYYCTGVKKFAGITTVTANGFEDHTPIWKSGEKKKVDDYPYRFPIELDIWLDDDQLIDAEEMAKQMTYTKKWPEKNWTLAFQGNVHKIEESDYQLLRNAIEAAKNG
ncbi:MAG: EVE domain-containing protein [Thermomicrobiales bacterium]|nr:EVE domain-containing protein [Thermomicrobiales bacterium]MCO5224404.1 EVE domain-containing protein [Thermomicrobiales bacterium]MCO5228230.1 EVE domain-containing protein [Thermomicrobiales bacterium]